MIKGNISECHGEHVSLESVTARTTRYAVAWYLYTYNCNTIHYNNEQKLNWYLMLSFLQTTTNNHQQSHATQFHSIQIVIHSTTTYAFLSPLLHLIELKVDLKGNVCLNILQAPYWNAGTSIIYLFVYIQWLLSNPNTNEYVNEDANEMIIYVPQLYNQMVLDNAIASKRIACLIITIIYDCSGSGSIE